MKKHILLPLILFIISSCLAHSQVQAQTISKNLSLGDFISYEDLYQSQVVPVADSVTLTDVASWRDDRNGKEYALVGLLTPGSGSGVAIVDVTDPGNAFYVKTIRIHDLDAHNTAHDVKVHNDNNIAYVAQNGNVNAHAYWVNLEDAIDNTTSNTVGTSTNGFQDLPHNAMIHNVYINSDHELLFLSDFRTGAFDNAQFNTGNAIQVFDISGGVPVHVDSIKHVAIPGLDNFYSHLVRSHDLYALTIDSTEGVIFDASIMAVTVFEYEWNPIPPAFTLKDEYVHAFNPRRGQEPHEFENEIFPKQIHSTWIGQNTDYLFTTVEGSSGEESFFETTWVDPTDTNAYPRANYLSVWNISGNPSPDPETGFRYPIEQVYEVRENTATGDGAFGGAYFSELSGEKANSIHNILTRDDKAFISYYTRGIRILDVSDLHNDNMSELAFYDVEGLEEYHSPVYNGAWGVDPFLPSETVLGSSSDGLYVFRPVGMFGGSVGVPTRWTTGITVVDELSVDSLVTVQGDVTVSFEADMELNNDIAMTGGSMITLASADGISTITSGDGVKTIGIPGTGGSARIDGGGGSGGPISPVTEELESRPGRFLLYQNYPNPFNPETVISYELPVDSKVRLEIYDILGRRVAVLINELKPAGVHQASWNATNAASGVYIYHLRAGDFVQSRQMMLVK